MKFEHYEHCRKEISRLNKIRNSFWNDLRKIRNEILQQYDCKKDEQALKLIRIINDMWESGYKEELRRRTSCLPKRDVQFETTAKGLYESNRFCEFCGLPIVGNNPRKKYCTEECQKLSKSRRWRMNNPEKKSIANFHYLNSTLTEEERKK